MFDVVVHGRATVQGVSVEQCWEVVTDHAGYADWHSLTSASRLASEGSPEPNGLGAIREFLGPDGAMFREIVNHYWAPTVLGYHIIGDAPFKDHQGFVVLKPEEDGTKIDWYMTCNNAGDPALAPALQDIVSAIMDTTVDELARACEKRAGQS